MVNSLPNQIDEKGPTGQLLQMTKCVASRPAYALGCTMRRCISALSHLQRNGPVVQWSPVVALYTRVVKRVSIISVHVCANHPKPFSSEHSNSQCYAH